MCGKLNCVMLRDIFGVILTALRGAHYVEESTLGTSDTDTEHSGITLCTYRGHACIHACMHLIHMCALYIVNVPSVAGDHDTCDSQKSPRLYD